MYLSSKSCGECESLVLALCFGIFWLMLKSVQEMFSCLKGWFGRRGNAGDMVSSFIVSHVVSLDRVEC